EQQVLATLEGLVPVVSEPEQVDAFNAKRDELITALQSAKGETSLQSKSAMIEKLLGNAQVFIKVVATQAGLSQDDQADVRQITELIATATP
ncbi:hypothetical protein NL460_27930, partial [Klebsiella pneumoniae]|nr:hypothetical protein [Klebsiella pneumoniae]